MFVLSDSPAERDLEWSNAGIDGCKKFIAKLTAQTDKIFNLLKKDKSNSKNNNELNSQVHATIKNVTEDILAYRLNKAIARIRELFNHISDEISKESGDLTNSYFGIKTVIQLLNPFIPHITEELWHTLQSRSEKDYLIVASMPKPLAVDTEILKQFEAAAELISQIRNLRKSKNISMKESIEVTFLKGRDTGHEKYHSLIMKLCNLSSIAETTSKPTGVASLMVKEHEYFIHTGSFINKDAERVRINQELDYTKSFLESVEKKLTNERFISNAKAEVIALEKKKQSDAEARIRLLTEQLEALKN